MTAAAESRSLNVAKSTLGMSGRKGAWYFSRGVAASVIASRFHMAIAHATVEVCSLAAARHQTEVVVLSGGVFANRWLLAETEAGLTAAGLRVLTPERLPAGDGGISYGQAAVAAASIGTGRC